MKGQEKVDQDNLRKVLSKYHDKEIYIKEIKDVEGLETPSRNFDIIRFKVVYKVDDKNRELNLISKTLKSSSPKKDFSNKYEKKGFLHERIESLFKHIQSNVKSQSNVNYNGEEDPVVRFYGLEDKTSYEEDAGNISMEKRFIEGTPDDNLLERLVNGIALDHTKWVIKLYHNYFVLKEDKYNDNFGTRLNDFNDIKELRHFREKLHENLDEILYFHNSKLNNSEDNILTKLFLGIDGYLTDKKDDFFVNFSRLIHSDLHLGHVFLKYEKIDDISEVNKDELKKQNPKIKIVDISEMSIGPQTFDLVDMLKHPVAINSDVYKTLDKQKEFIEKLVKTYIDGQGVKCLFGKKFEEELNFVYFYISNLYRDIRGAAKGILLRSHPENKDLYKIYLKLNKDYPKYSSWYLADLGETLNYLSSERFDENLFRGHLTKKLIKEAYRVLSAKIEDISKSSIEISRSIIKYQ